MLRTFYLLSALSFGFFGFTAQASLIHFDLRAPNIEELDGSRQFDYALSGVIATVAANTGVLNRTGSGFGVDIVGSGCDNSDAIDRSCAGVDSEAISVWFNQRVELVSAQISGLTGGDIAHWLLPDSNSLFYSSAGVYTPGSDVFLDPGEMFSFASFEDNTTRTQRGFSFDGFTVRLVARGPITVNESSTLYLLFIGLASLVFFRR